MGVYAAEETTGFAFETLTVDNTAGGVAMTAATYANGTRALITCEAAEVRYTYDGTAPTTTVGHLASIGTRIELVGPANLTQFRAIRTGGTSGTLQITYER